MSELPYTFPIRWYGDALDAYAPFAGKTGAFMIAIDKRYTLIGWEPRHSFSANGGFVTVDGRTRIGNSAEELQNFVAPFQTLPRDSYFPFYSGLVGYMLPDFNTAAEVAADATTPQAWFGVYDPVIVYDQVEQNLTILSMGLDEAFFPSDSLAEERAIQLAQQLVRYNGKPAAADVRDATVATPSPLQFVPLDAIQAQCASAVQ